MEDEDDDSEAETDRRTYLGNILSALRSVRRRRQAAILGARHQPPPPPPLHPFHPHGGSDHSEQPLFSQSEQGAMQCNDFKEDRLGFRVEFSDGGEFSADYAPSNFLNNDTSCYCSTRRRNVNVVLRFDPEEAELLPFSFTMTHAIVKAPVTGFTSPVKDVLIFVSEAYPDIEASKKFDGMTYSDYLSFLEQSKEAGTGPQPDDPAAFLTVEKETHCGFVALCPIRSGRYVLVKFLASDGFEENIDCQFVGFQGFVGKRAFPHGSFL